MLVWLMPDEEIDKSGSEAGLLGFTGGVVESTAGGSTDSTGGGVTESSGGGGVVAGRG